MSAFPSTESRLIGDRKSDLPSGCFGPAERRGALRKSLLSEKKKELLKKGRKYVKHYWRDDGFGIEWAKISTSPILIDHSREASPAGSASHPGDSFEPVDLGSVDPALDLAVTSRGTEAESSTRSVPVTKVQPKQSDYAQTSSSRNTAPTRTSNDTGTRDGQDTGLPGASSGTVEEVRHDASGSRPERDVRREASDTHTNTARPSEDKTHPAKTVDTQSTPHTYPSLVSDSSSSVVVPWPDHLDPTVNDFENTAEFTTWRYKQWVTASQVDDKGFATRRVEFRITPEGLEVSTRLIGLTDIPIRAFVPKEKVQSARRGSDRSLMSHLDPSLAVEPIASTPHGTPSIDTKPTSLSLPTIQSDVKPRSTSTYVPWPAHLSTEELRLRNKKEMKTWCALQRDAVANLDEDGDPTRLVSSEPHRKA